jgi:hypothetical protein
MVASPKLSKWFYDYVERNCRLPSTDDNSSPRAARRNSGPGRPRGFAPGSGRANHLTAGQRQILIDLLNTTRNVSQAHRLFVEAQHGTVSKVAVWNTAKREGIELHRSPPSARHQL